MLKVKLWESSLKDLDLLLLTKYLTAKTLMTTRTPRLPAHYIYSTPNSILLPSCYHPSKPYNIILCCCCIICSSVTACHLRELIENIKFSRSLIPHVHHFPADHQFYQWDKFFHLRNCLCVLAVILKLWILKVCFNIFWWAHIAQCLVTSLLPPPWISMMVMNFTIILLV